MRANKTKAAAIAGTPALGIMCNSASPLVAEHLGHAGYDFVIVDMQHGENNLDNMQVMLQALSTTGTTPLVRVPANMPVYIQRVLDLGAYGVIVPMVNTPEEARQAVASVRYAPQGERSWGPTRATMYSGAGYFAESPKELLTLVMLESAGGLKNVEAIMAVDGVDGCFVGPKDLGISLGHSPDLPDLPDEAEQAVRTIFAAARGTGKIAGVHTFGPAEAKKRIDGGATLLSVSSDTAIMRASSSAALSQLRA
jgi:4-hydroxy-2-oxoheptanedioate aldolase